MAAVLSQETIGTRTRGETGVSGCNIEMQCRVVYDMGIVTNVGHAREMGRNPSEKYNYMSSL